VQLQNYKNTITTYILNISFFVRVVSAFALQSIFMSFLVGPIAGGLVAGGVYYGFSNLILTRTAQHRRDIHALSERLVDASTAVPSPTPASARIAHRPFASLLKDQWNRQTAAVYGKVRSLDERAQELGRKILYRPETRKDES